MELGLCSRTAPQEGFCQRLIPERGRWHPREGS